jgi:hypothetical protein
MGEPDGLTGFYQIVERASWLAAIIVVGSIFAPQNDPHFARVSALRKEAAFFLPIQESFDILALG